MSLGNAFRNRDNFIPPRLQITAMMDMFTIIVFFLLFSYSDRPDEIDLESNIDLPVSSTERNYENTIKVFLSPQAITIEGEQVAAINNGRIQGFNEKNPLESNLYKTLERLRQEKTTANPETEEEQASTADKPQVLFFCDKAVPFKLMNTVMKTIGMVGYPNMQLAVTGER